MSIYDKIIQEIERLGYSDLDIFTIAGIEKGEDYIKLFTTGDLNKESISYDLMIQLNNNICLIYHDGKFNKGE